MNAMKKWLHDMVDSLPDDMELDEAASRIHMIARHKASLKQYREQGGGVSADEMRRELKARNEKMREAK